MGQALQGSSTGCQAVHSAHPPRLRLGPRAGIGGAHGVAKPLPFKQRWQKRMLWAGAAAETAAISLTTASAESFMLWTGPRCWAHAAVWLVVAAVAASALQVVSMAVAVVKVARSLSGG